MDYHVAVRVFDPERDCPGVEAVETICDVGTGKVSLFTDLLGDPTSRIRHTPASLMLVRCIYTTTFSFFFFFILITVYRSR